MVGSRRAVSSTPLGMRTPSTCCFTSWPWVPSSMLCRRNRGRPGDDLGWNMAADRYVSVEAPLFIHQYSHAWFDFRGVHDEFLDYFENSVTATRVHRQFCLDLRTGVPALRRESLGHHGLRFGPRLRGLGRTAAARAIGWHAGAVCGGWVAAVSSVGMPAVPAHHAGTVRGSGVAALWFSWMRLIRRPVGMGRT